MNDVFVVGDVHGHVDRLEALLLKAKVGKHDCTVVQLGDLGHFGWETKDGDLAAWNRARSGYVDLVLWGNHDRAVFHSYHHFNGYSPPEPETKHVMNQMEQDGRLLMAYEAHGWLITHAGLHAEFENTYLLTETTVDRHDARSIADWINERCRSGDTEPVIDAVGRSRGGVSPFGGILWRDVDEDLWDGVPQVFGHSASSQQIVRGEKNEWYCVDIGGKGGAHYHEADCLAGIWLPSQEIVRVDHVEITRETKALA